MVTMREEEEAREARGKKEKKSKKEKNRNSTGTQRPFRGYRCESLSVSPDIRVSPFYSKGTRHLHDSLVT